MNGKRLLGIILILCGLSTLISSLGYFEGESTLFLVSLGFFIAYFYFGNQSGNYKIGFLIPACIILAVGSYNFIQDNMKLNELEGATFFFFLGGGFFLIHAISNAVRHEMKLRSWSLRVAVCLWAFGAFVLLTEYIDIFDNEGVKKYIVPIAFILFGVYILTSSVIKKEH